MEFEEIIQELQNLISAAGRVAHAGYLDEAKIKLRRAKELLEIAFLWE